MLEYALKVLQLIAMDGVESLFMPLTTGNLFNIRTTVEIEFDGTLESLTERTLQVAWVKKLLQALRQQLFKIPSTLETDESTMTDITRCYYHPQSSFATLTIPEVQLADVRMVIRLTLYQLIIEYSQKYNALQRDPEFCAELNLTKQYFRKALQNIPKTLFPPLVMAPILSRHPQLIIHDRLNRGEFYLNQVVDNVLFLFMGLISAIALGTIMPRSPLNNGEWDRNKIQFIAVNFITAVFFWYKVRPYVAECLFFSARRRGVESITAVSRSEARRIGVLTP